MEEWVQAKYLTENSDLISFDGIKVSNLGRVLNTKTNHILSVRKAANEYYYVHISINGKDKQCRIHRLVLSSFTDNVDGSLQVNHKDENKSNNCLNNLEWVSAKDNMNYGTRTDRAIEKQRKKVTGVYNTKNSKPILQLDLEGNIVKEWPSIKEIERTMGYSKGNICCCCRGKQKTGYGFLWKYKD